MRVRFQILTSEIDESEFDSVVDDAIDQRIQAPRFLAGRFQQGAGPFDLLVARAETPRRVSSREGEAELEEVKRMLLEEKIKPDDLCDIGKGWQSIRECYPFEETVLVVDARARKRRWLDAAFILGALVVSSILAYYFVIKE